MLLIAESACETAVTPKRYVWASAPGMGPAVSVAVPVCPGPRERVAGANWAVPETTPLGTRV